MTVRIFVETIKFGVILLFLSGCTTNKYEEYFSNIDGDYYCQLQPYGNDNEVKIKPVISDADMINAIEDGYLPVGHSSFEGPYESVTQAIDVAKEYNAQLILVDIKFKTRKEYSSVAIMPSTTSSYTYGTVNAGSNMASYSGWTTGTTMTAVPVMRAIDIYTHNVVFMKKVSSSDFYGVVPCMPQRLPGEKQTDAVDITILGVVRGSAADRAGLKSGQRIAKINGTEITDLRSLKPFISSVLSIKEVEALP